MSIAEALADDTSVRRAAEFPYQTVLLREECEKLEKLSQKLDKKLNDRIHIWVHDGTPAARKPFKLSVKVTTPVGDIRDKIAEMYNAEGSYDRELDGALRLLYAGQTLIDGKRLCDYPSDTIQNKWARPYAGIVWVVPFKVETQNSLTWGSSIPEDAQDILPEEWK